MEEYQRLHITPLNPSFLKAILPPSVESAARNISYHTIQTFPEKGYGYVDLPLSDAERIKKKLNGCILQGTKVRIQMARSISLRALEPEQPQVERLEQRKRKRAKDELPGVEIGNRRVKRGWTTPVHELKKPSINAEKLSVKSKYTTAAECLFKTVLPPNVASKSETAGTKIKKKKKKGGKETVVHEFANTTKYATFLKNSSASNSSKVVKEFIEGVGWVDQNGEVIERAVKSKKIQRDNPTENTIVSSGLETPKERRDALKISDQMQLDERSNISNAGLDTCDEKSKKPSRSSVSSIAPEDDETDSSESSAAPEENPSKKSKKSKTSRKHTKASKHNDMTVPSSSSSSPPSPSLSPAPSLSSSSSSSSSSEDNEAASHRPISMPAKGKNISGNILNPSSDSVAESMTSRSDEEAEGEHVEKRKQPISKHSQPSPSASLSIQIPSSFSQHPLEVLYKKSEALSPGNQPSKFRFFAVDNEDSCDDDPSKSQPENDVAMPLTPFTKREIEHRTVRSAAPTPDTAYFNKRFVWPSGNEGHSLEENENKKKQIQQMAGDFNGSKPADASLSAQDEFQKWFWEQRGALNRSWKKRRKTVLKEQRQRDNRKKV